MLARLHASVHRERPAMAQGRRAAERVVAVTDLQERTAPPASPRPRRMSSRIRTWARRRRRVLTSMRTAIVLLFCLALAAVPGSLLPQRSLPPSAVQMYYRDHPTLAPLLDRLGIFVVFTSPWFAAVYLLLFISPHALDALDDVIPKPESHAL